MIKFDFDDFMRVMSYDVCRSNTCIEIEFCIDQCVEYQTSWLGKMIERGTGKSIYWYGLVEDGSQAYDFESIEEFINAKIFCDNSIKEIWSLISVISIDACEPKERLSFYLQ